MKPNAIAGLAITLNLLILAGILIKFPSPTLEKSNEITQGMQVSSDKEFLEQMIPHHQEAVATSHHIIDNSNNAELKDFARKIVLEQSEEINQMERWYINWFERKYQDNNVYKPMMPEFTTLNANEADMKYIEGMIHHHNGAIEMAKQVLEFTNREELRALAQSIIANQTSEIQTLQNWLTTNNQVDHSSHGM